MSKQGQPAKTGSKSDKGQSPNKRTEERGIGSEFANSVATVLSEARNLRGSSNSFLGVDKKVIDPKEYSDSLTKRKKR